MRKLQKTLGIILTIAMLFTLMPIGMVSAAEGYVEARNTISFATFKGNNVNGQYNVTEPLAFPATVADPATGTEYRVEWFVSNTSAVSADGLTITPMAVDQWVTITARVHHEEGKGYVERDIKIRVPSNGEYLMNETFTDETAGQLTNTDSEAGDWYINGDPAAAGTTFTITNDSGANISGQALQMSARASGSNFFATATLSETPSSGTVVYSSDVRFSNSSISFPYWPFWFIKGLDNIKFPYGTAGDQTISYTFGTNTWHHVDTVYDFDENTIDIYIDGTWIAGANSISSGAKSGLGTIQARMQAATGTGSFNYIDNVQVKYLLKDEKSELLAFNPATKGAIYADANLATTIELNDTQYPVTYASSDESVIASDGTVTRSDFFRTVTVTPQVAFGDTVLNGTATKLTVLPISSNYAVRLDESFENIDVLTETGTDGEAGDMFKTDLTPVDADAGWVLASSWASNYTTNYNAGGRLQIVNDNGNKVLRMKHATTAATYRLEKTGFTNPDCGDRTAIAMRVKLVSGSMNLSSPYMGRLRPWFRGDFGGNSTDTDVENITYDNNWHTYLFVYDSGIVETKKNADAYPISLYIDGEYKGTSWTRGLYGGDAAFYLMQWGTHGLSEVLVDDILLMNFDSEALQIADVEVENGTVTTADVQYVSYESDMTAAMKLIVAAYNADNELVGAKLVDATPITVGDNAVTVNYELPDTADYYRLFLFDGMNNIKPLSLSRIYNIAE